MLKSGMPEIFVDATLQLATSIRAGQMSAVLPTFEQVLGRKGLANGPSRTRPRSSKPPGDRSNAARVFRRLTTLLPHGPPDSSALTPVVLEE